MIAELISNQTTPDQQSRSYSVLGFTPQRKQRFRCFHKNPNHCGIDFNFDQSRPRIEDLTIKMVIQLHPKSDSSVFCELQTEAPKYIWIISDSDQDCAIIEDLMGFGHMACSKKWFYDLLWYSDWNPEQMRNRLPNMIHNRRFDSGFIQGFR